MFELPVQPNSAANAATLATSSQVTAKLIWDKYRKTQAEGQVQVLIHRFVGIPEECVLMPVVLEIHDTHSNMSYWLHRNFAFVETCGAWESASKHKTQGAGIRSMPGCFVNIFGVNFTDGNDVTLKTYSKNNNSHYNHREGICFYLKKRADTEVENKKLKQVCSHLLLALFIKGSPFRHIYYETRMGKSTNQKLQEALNPETGYYYTTVIEAMNRAKIEKHKTLKAIFDCQIRGRIALSMFSNPMPDEGSVEAKFIG